MKWSVRMLSASRSRNEAATAERQHTAQLAKLERTAAARQAADAKDRGRGTQVRLLSSRRLRQMRRRAREADRAFATRGGTIELA